MAKNKSRKAAPKPNRVAVKADRKTNKGGIRMVNAGGVSTPSSTKAVDDARATAQDTFAAQQVDEIGSLAPRQGKGKTEGETPAQNKRRRSVRANQQVQLVEGQSSLFPRSRQKAKDDQSGRVGEVEALPVGNLIPKEVTKTKEGRTLRPVPAPLYGRNTTPTRTPVAKGKTAAAVAEASVPVAGTGAGSGPAPVVSTAPGKLVKVRKTRKGRGSVGAPDSAGSGDMIEIRDRAEIARDRASVRNRRGAVTPGRSRSDRRALASSSLSSTATTTDTRRRGSRKFTKLTSSQVPTAQERAGGAYEGDAKTARPDADVPKTASERHIYYAMKARESDVQNVSSNIENRQIQEAVKRAGTSKAANPKDVEAALKAKKIKKSEAKDLLENPKVAGMPRIGIQGSKADTEAALKAGHITETDAMHISAEYAADRLVPTTDKYVGSDLAMAHELSNHLGHPASLIHNYVKEKVPGGMKEFRDKVVSNIRGEGELTHWTPTGDAANPYSPTSSRKSGTVRARRRKGLENRTVTVKTPKKGPKGSLPHQDYVKLQIANYADESPSQKTSRRRGSHPITDSIVSDVMAHGAVSVRTAEGETFDYKKVGESVKQVSKPKAKSEGFVPPKGSGGSVAIAENAGTTPVVYKKAGFTSVRSPRRPI